MKRLIVGFILVTVIAWLTASPITGIDCGTNPKNGGDSDANGANDISDLTYYVDFMFGGGPEPPCMPEADVNGDGVGPDITDLVYMVDYMFSGGPPPVDCP